mmetsp:Transcript_74731/g.173079  ORF Transcript_74731/g.173079 Transcript_74731/m.173079 type:complete len:202 (+) Transcript_74731:103-708(+)
MDANVNEASSDAGSISAPFVRQVRPWFVALLLLQVLLTLLRWRLGDAHGALLMLAVVAVGTLAVVVGGRGSIDEVYGGYFGLMALVSGLLDLNLSIEHLVWGEWRHIHRLSTREHWEAFAKPVVFLVCAVVQLFSALIAYLLYKESEGDGDMDASEPVFATPEQARIYNAVLHHSSMTHGRQPAAGVTPQKPFVGAAHKLP